MIKTNVKPIFTLNHEKELEYWRNKTATNHKIVSEAYFDVKCVVRYCVSHIDWMFNLENRRREQVVNMTPAKFTELATGYHDDDRSFRRAFRKLVSWVIDSIPCWNIDQHSSIVYRCIYDEMDKIVKEHHTNPNVTFQRECFEHFQDTRVNDSPPYDIWRRINLCATSAFWESVAVQAMLKSPEAIIQALAKDLGVAHNMKIIDDKVCFLTPQQMAQLNRGE